MERNRRPPSDVEEALSSMLWTPYPCTPSVSSDEEIDNENSHKCNAKDKDQHLFVIDRCENAINHNNNRIISSFVPKSCNPINGQLPSYDFIENKRHIKNFKELFFGSKNVSQTNVNYDRSSSLTRNSNDIYVIQSSEWNTTSMVQPILGDSSLHQILNANTKNPTLQQTTKTSNSCNTKDIQISNNNNNNNGNSIISENEIQIQKHMIYDNNNSKFVKSLSMNQSNISPSASFNNLDLDTMQTSSIPKEHTEAIRYDNTSSVVKICMCIQKNTRCSCNVQNHCKNLPERVTQLQHTNINASQLHTHLDENVAIRAHNNVIYNNDEMNGVGDDDRLNSTTAPTTKMMKIETTTTTTTETVNIGLRQRLFSRDRLFHASVSSKAHAFFDFLKFSRNSESTVRNFTNFNRGSSVNSCAIAAMQLNVPNEDHSAVAVSDPFINLSTRISHIDNNNAVNIVSSRSNLIIPITAGGPSTTVNTETIKTVTPPSSQIFENGILIGAIGEQPNLTIQINQSNHNQKSEQSQINEERTQQVNFVSCRAVPMQVVSNGDSVLHSQQKKNNIIICESDNANNNSTNDHIISNQIKIISSSRTSEKNENCDKIVLINETQKQSEYVNYNSEHINEDNTNNSSTIQIGNLKRTFVSTEAQTDELQQPTSTDDQNIQNLETTNTITTPGGNSTRIIDSLIQDDRANSSQTKSGQAHSRRRSNDIESHLAREQRRRERRGRQPRSSRQHHNHPSNQAIAIHSRNVECEVLPDILHNHVPPPYTTLPLTQHCPITGASVLSQTPPQSVLVTRPPSLIPVGISDVGRFTYPLPIIRRSPSERSGKDCCGQWFAGPPLRAVIAVVALGGVACALGGAALGATGLAGPPTSHLTAALLMIGVGVILVSVSAAAWRMTAPGNTQCLGIGTSELGRCGRRTGCTGRLPQFLYPEFQHRPPPPTYQASMQEYRLRLLLLDRDRQVHRNNASPPPTYRSHGGTLLRVPLSVRGHSGAAHSSECSLPPSYRSRNNLLRIPALISGNFTGNTNQNRINNVNSNGETNTKQSKSANTNIQEIDQLYLNTNSSSSHGPVTEASNTKPIDTNNDNNDLVTIVSITDCTANGTTNSEMDILAHL